MKNLFGFALLLLSTSGLAALTGTYDGPGSARFAASGSLRQCDSIRLHFAASSSQIELLAGGYDCEDLSASFDPFVLEVRNGRIYSSGDDVGTYANGVLDLFYQNDEEKFTYHWLITETPTGLTYLEEWTDNGKPALTVKGQLKRLP